ncbi:MULTISPECIES: ricin-type beta-trefoil lectin domain protein [unclassified Amycolatopsis]|uniref:ricin-type beta-trefoil lectin domain protein n=1 Tax=unclassified Amycolatopsis TaxID=2618356 RepID=UPI00287600B1|nr:MULTISPECIES: ricin-type beta-trefoil lectin domain protein [unclassified Amycolatopsis]MDS0138722.1 ricin-type beta-trefoil lectin domain protein [Amycolatopsis sp. 505]MDS0147216.1 ricin-type beta-trefoil lectin domain protein [Amycolatopsis sp. CM201R]
MRTRLRWLAAAVAVLAGTLLPGTAAAESNGGVRVMPLGDSITEGTQVPGGYRIGLWQRVTAGGYQVDFVGSQFNGPASLGDHDHEGHPGWRIDQIDANITGWLRTSSPHTVLLHIGTNDILQNYNVSGAPGRLSALVDHITGAVPDAEVFVATIIPIANSGQEAAARTFNATIPGMVQSKQNAGKHVHLVDMHAALTAADLIDGVHPTATGYDKMAAVWYAALQAVPGSIGTPGQSSAKQLVGTQSGRCADVPSTADGTPVQLADCAGAPWTPTGKQLTTAGNKCLDASGQGTADGTPVIIWTCSGQANQQWNVNADGTITGVQSGRCLDATGQGTTAGTKLILWSCHGQANQKWTLRAGG